AKSAMQPIPPMELIAAIVTLIVIDVLLAFVYGSVPKDHKVSESPTSLVLAPWLPELSTFSEA
ncbi:MAG: hypothetical protein AB1Z22_00710, partial [Synechococcaceae cyanobacterium]